VKILKTLILCILALLALAGCGGNRAEATPPTTPPVHQENVAEAPPEPSPPLERYTPAATENVTEAPELYAEYDPESAGEPEPEPETTPVPQTTAPATTAPPPAAPELGFYVNDQFMSMSTLRSLGIREFYAHIRPGTDREEMRYYRGVAMGDVLGYFGIDAASGTSVAVHAYDGFGASISMADALLEGEAYIAIWQDGHYFIERGDIWATAPFQLVMARHIFANFFVRYITEIVVQ